MDDKPVIELWDMSRAYGVIVPHTSGVKWSNQCGGTMCAHPVIEGIYIPLPSFVGILKLNYLRDDWYGRTLRDPLDGAKNYLAARVKLQAMFDDLYPGAFAPLGKDDPELSLLDETGWGEAWVPLRIVVTNNWKQLEPFMGKVAILTYPNSD